MSNNVVSIFKNVLRAMGQCPECRGYIVRLNLDWLMAEQFPDEPELRESAIKTEGTNWHCLECGCRWWLPPDELFVNETNVRLWPKADYRNH